MRRIHFFNQIKIALICVLGMGVLSAFSLQGCGNPKPKVEKEKEIKAVQKSNLHTQNLQFETSEAFIALFQKNREKISMVTKSSPNEVAIYTQDGLVFQRLDSEKSPTVTTLVPLLAPPENAQMFTFSKGQFWLLDEGQISRTQNPPNLPNASESEGNLAKLSSLKTGGTKWKILGVQGPKLIAWSGTALYIVSAKDEFIKAQEVTWPTKMVGAKDVPLAAGFGEDAERYWVATRSRLLVLGKKEKEWNWDVKKWSLAGLKGDIRGIGLYLAAGNSNEPKGTIYVLTTEGLYSTEPSDVVKSAASQEWAQEIKFLSERHCLSCHDSKSDNGFSRANEEGSWTGLKRDSIIARVSGKTMPPAGSPQAAAIKDTERDAITQWLKNSVGTPTPSDASNYTPPPPPPPSQGGEIPKIPEVIPEVTTDAVWNGTVKKIIDSGCLPCHANYKMRSYVLLKKEAIKSEIEAGRMPKFSPGAITQEEKSSLINWLNAN
jgi:mono/diheme cytochrome c family protein